MIVNKNKLVEEIINNISFLEEPREGIKINNDKFLINETKEESLVTIKNSCILYNTNMNYPKSMGSIYSSNMCIFVVDFKNEDYFWLDEHIVIKNKYTLI